MLSRASRARELALGVTVMLVVALEADSKAVSCPLGSFNNSLTTVCENCCPTNFNSKDSCQNMSAWLAFASSQLLLSPSDGSMIWSFQTGGSILHEPIASQDGTRVYVGSLDNYLYALDAATGFANWSLRTDGGIEMLARGRADTPFLYAVTDRSLYAFDVLQGSMLWSRTVINLFPQVHSLCASPDGSKLFLGAGNQIFAYDSSTSSQIWSFSTIELTIENVYFVVVTPDGSMVFVGSWDYNVYALDANTGSKLWSYKFGSSPLSDPLVSPDGSKLFVHVNGEMIVLNASTGAKIWQTATEPYSFSMAINPEGSVVYVGNVPKIIALRSEDGTQIWTRSINLAQVLGLRVSPDGIFVYMHTLSNQIYALYASDGSSAWSFQADCNIQKRWSFGITINPSNTNMYVVCDTALQALETRYLQLDWYLNRFGRSDCANPRFVGLWKTKSSQIEPVGVSPDGKTVYTMWDYQITAVDALRGTTMQDYSFDKQYLSTPTLSLDGRIMYLRVGLSTVDLEQAYIAAVDTVTAKLVWSQTPHQSQFLSAPVVSGDGKLVFAFSNHLFFLYAWDAGTGSLMWSKWTYQMNDGGIRAQGDYLYLTGSQAKKLNASTGSEIWSHTVESVFLPCVTPDGRHVVVGSTDLNVHGLNGTTGEEVWRYSRPYPIWGELASSPDSAVVFAADMNFHIFALNVSNGNLVWLTYAGHQVFTTLVVSPDGSLVYVWFEDGTVIVFDALSGVEVWRWNEGGYSYSMSPVLSPDGLTVYLTSSSNELTAFRMEPCITLQKYTGHSSLLYQNAQFNLQFECKFVFTTNISQYKSASGLVKTTSMAASSEAPTSTSVGSSITSPLATDHMNNPQATPSPASSGGDSFDGIEVTFWCTLSGLSVSEYKGDVEQAFESAVLASMNLLSDPSTHIRTSASSAGSRRSLNWRQQTKSIKIFSTVQTSVPNQGKAVSLTSQSLATQILHSSILNSDGISLRSMGPLTVKNLKATRNNSATQKDLIIILVSPIIGTALLLFGCFVASKKGLFQRNSSASRSIPMHTLPAVDCSPSAPSFESLYRQEYRDAAASQHSRLPGPWTSTIVLSGGSSSALPPPDADMAETS
eukprot:609923-Hanusia_phi.AAC.1